MTLTALMAWVTANEAFLVTLALVISEFLGANPRIKSNGILSFLLIQADNYLKNRKKPSA